MPTTKNIITGKQGDSLHEIFFTINFYFFGFANVYIEALEYADHELKMFRSDAEVFARKLMEHRQPEKLLEGHQILYRFADSSSGYGMFRSDAIEEANRLFSMRSLISKLAVLSMDFVMAKQI